MLFLLQAGKSISTAPLDRLPSFTDLISTYGAYLTTIIVAVVAIIWLQYSWFQKIIKSKDTQIQRMDEKEKELFDRLKEFLDQ